MNCLTGSTRTYTHLLGSSNCILFIIWSGIIVSEGYRGPKSSGTNIGVSANLPFTIKRLAGLHRIPRMRSATIGTSIQ